MEAKQLRIGNLVLDPDGEVSTILSISAESKYTDAKYYLENDYNGHPDDLKPIALTEEWLLELGFEKYRIEKHSQSYLKNKHLLLWKKYDDDITSCYIYQSEKDDFELCDSQILPTHLP